MCLNNLSSYLTKLGSIITALADLINTFTLASYGAIYAAALLDEKLTHMRRFPRPKKPASYASRQSSA